MSSGIKGRDHLGGGVVSESLHVAFSCDDRRGGDRSISGRFRARHIIMNHGDGLASSGVFTAPVKGIYSFSWTAFANQNGGRFCIRKNGTIVAQEKGNGWGGLHIHLELEAGDKVSCGGVSDQFKGHYYAAVGHNCFSGALLFRL